MNTTFAENHKDLRAESEISQSRLAKKMNVSQSLISLWENGLREPTLSNLVALADIFDVSLDYLAGRDTD